MSASGHATPAATEPSAPHIQYIGSWPELNDAQLAAIIAANVGSFILSWIMLRLVWKAPSEKQIRAEKELEVRIQAWKAQYGSIDGTMPASASPVECLEGESAGEYTEPWTKTFDFFFLILMIVFLAALCIWTQLTHPELFTNPYFWLEQLPKVGLMMFVSVLGGLCCRYFCRVDERGYIITSKTDKFKVNYTRKLQHFAAYLIPLVLQTHAAKDIEGQKQHTDIWMQTTIKRHNRAFLNAIPALCINPHTRVFLLTFQPFASGPLTLCWGNWFTLRQSNKRWE